MVRSANLEDVEKISRIYNYYVNNSTITFEISPVTSEDMKGRILSILSTLPYFVYEEDGNVIGYAYASKWKERSAYRYSVETTVYLDNQYTGKGIGTILYNELLTALKAKGLHRAIAGIALPNSASISLHEKLGFVKKAEFDEVGYKFDNWINVGYWELKL